MHMLKKESESDFYDIVYFFQCLHVTQYIGSYLYTRTIIYIWRPRSARQLKRRRSTVLTSIA